MARSTPKPGSLVEDPLLDEAEARRQLGNITERHLRNLRERRELVGVRFGRVVKYRQSAVDACVQRLEQQQQAS